MSSTPRPSYIVESHCCGNLPKLLQRDQGIANIQLNGDWTEAELEVGGQCIDKIYKHLDINAFPILANGYCLPSLAGHSYTVHCKHDGRYMMTYDIVILEPSTYDFVYDTYHLENSGFISEGLSTTNINHSVEKIIVLCQKSLTSAPLLHRLDSSSTIIPLQRISENRWEIDIGTQINQTRLHIDSPTTNDVTIFSSRRRLAHIYNRCLTLE